MAPIILRQTKAKFVLGGSLNVSSYKDVADPKIMYGLPNTLEDLPSPPIEYKSDSEGSFAEIVIPQHFPSGSVLIFATEMEGIDRRDGRTLRQRCHRSLR